MCLCWLKAIVLGSLAIPNSFTGILSPEEAAALEEAAGSACCATVQAVKSLSNNSLIFSMVSYFFSSLPLSSLSRSHKVSLTWNFPNGRATLSNSIPDFWMESQAASIRASEAKMLFSNFLVFSLSKSDFVINLANPSFWEPFGEVTWQHAKATLSIGKVVLPCFQSQWAKSSEKSCPNIREPPYCRPQLQQWDEPLFPYMCLYWLKETFIGWNKPVLAEKSLHWLKWACNGWNEPVMAWSFDKRHMQPRN